MSKIKRGFIVEFSAESLFWYIILQNTYPMAVSGIALIPNLRQVNVKGFIKEFYTCNTFVKMLPI